jgi:hypothetical protein
VSELHKRLKAERCLRKASEQWLKSELRTRVSLAPANGTMLRLLHRTAIATTGQKAGVYYSLSDSGGTE